MSQYDKTLTSLVATVTELDKLLEQYGLEYSFLLAKLPHGHVRSKQVVALLHLLLTQQSYPDVG